MTPAPFQRAAAGCGALLCAVATWPAHALDASQVFEKVAPSVWVILTHDASERTTSLGSAVVTGPGRLATTCRVLADTKVILLRRANVMYEAKLEHRDPSRDVCLLQVENFNAPAVEQRSVKDLKVGERVYAIGNPKGLEATLSEGLISGLRTLDESGPTGGGTLVQTSAAISAGSGGGGLFDTEGRLVGITTFGWREAQNLNIALPTDWIAQVPGREQAAMAKGESRAAAATGARASNAAPGLPAPGTTWSYSFVERIFSRRRFEVTVRALNANDTLVEEAISASASGAKNERRIVDARASRFLEFRLDANNILIELAPYLVAANEGKAPSGMPRADGYPQGGSDLPDWIVSTTVREWEEVTVPAGKFRALRMDVAGQRSTYFGGPLDFTGRFEMTVWYAPEVKRYVRMEHRAWSQNRHNPRLLAHDVVELLAYQPSSQK